MKKALLIALSLSGIALLFTGCTSKTEQDSTIPWSRPANWEGGIPGMGSMGTQGSGYR